MKSKKKLEESQDNPNGLLRLMVAEQIRTSNRLGYIIGILAVQIPILLAILLGG